MIGSDDLINNKSKELMVCIMEFKKLIDKSKPSLNISHGEFLMLKTIKDLEENKQLVNMSLISNNLDISNSAVSQIIKALEKRCLVKKIVSSNDKRNNYIIITEEGNQILNKAKERMLFFMSNIIDDLGEQDTDKLIELINKLKNIAIKGKEDQQ